METYYTINYLSRKRKRQRKERIIFYIAGILIAILAAFLLTRFCVFGITMRGDSMKPAMKDGQFCVASRLSYAFSSPKKGDIIVFKTSDESSSFYIKRVVATGGDTIQIKDGKIFVNEKEVEMKGTEEILSAGLASNKITLGKDQYFVLGDNYNNSEDSRVSSIGNVRKENILGKIQLKLW
jgi:signal peptidase I